MTTEPLVSVVVPTFNRGALVGRAVASALGQTHHQIEVLVVDDGSTDGTIDLLEERYGAEDRVHLIRTEHRGPAAARNAGIEAGHGSHVAFLDSDDEWFGWKVEFQLDCMERFPDLGMIWTDMAAVNPDGAIVSPRHIRSLYHRHSEISLADLMSPSQVATPTPAGSSTLWQGDIYAAMIHGNLVHTSTVMISRHRLEAVGRFDESLTGTGEDFDFHLRTCAAGPVGFADVTTTRWRSGAPDQLTRPDLMATMARNYLTTVEKAVAADPGRLGDRDRRVAIARAQAWLGEELLDSGNRSGARTHLRSALLGKRRSRTIALVVVAYLPRRIGDIARRLLGTVTRPFRRRAEG